MKQLCRNPNSIDLMNSYNRRMTENIYIMGVNYHYDYKNNDKKLQSVVNLTLPLSVFDRNSSYTRYTLDTCLTQSSVFFEPSLTVSRNKWRDNNLMERNGFYIIEVHPS